MTEGDRSGEDGGSRGALRDAWMEVGDDLLAGMGHTLANRVAALTAVAQVMGASDDGPLGAALSAESTRLTRAVQLLRLLVRRWGAEPEPVVVVDVLADAAALLAHHPELRDVSVEVDSGPGVGPLWAERTALTHAFCLLLIEASRAAMRAGESSVPVRCEGTPREVRVSIPLPRDANGAAARRGAAALLEDAGGVVESTEEAGGITGLEVRLPTLLEIRRRERDD